MASWLFIILLSVMRKNNIVLRLKIEFLKALKEANQWSKKKKKIEMSFPCTRYSQLFRISWNKTLSKYISWVAG